MHLNELDIYAPDIDVGEEDYSNTGGWGSVVTGAIGSTGSLIGEVGKVKKYNKALKQRHDYYEKQKKNIREKLILEQEAKKQRALAKMQSRIKRVKRKVKGRKKEIMWVGGIFAGLVVIGGSILLYKKFA